MKDIFLQLVRLGIGHHGGVFPAVVDLEKIKALAEQQGLSAIVLDGIEVLRTNLNDNHNLNNLNLPDKLMLVQWIGEVHQFYELRHFAQQKAASEMASLLYKNYIRTYVLKGVIVGECYPNPTHRNSVDMDCFLMPICGDFDAWALGNDLCQTQGFEVKLDFYKNSTIYLPKLTVENHLFMVPFRGNKTLKELEKLLQRLLHEDMAEDKIDGTDLYRPPVMMSALFLIEHAYSHFLHEGLTWKHVLDWMMFSRKHQSEIDWNTFDVLIDRFGFRKFYDSYFHLGKYLLGEMIESDLTKADKLMIDDVWADLDLHETVNGFKGKLSLAGNTWRARWKYRYFTDMTWIEALWIQVKGFLFEKYPRLD